MGSEGGPAADAVEELLRVLELLVGRAPRGLEGPVAEEQLDEHGAEAPGVGPAPAVGLGRHELRREEARRPHEVREPRVAGDVRAEPEVAELHDALGVAPRRRVAHDEHVLGLDVAVGDPGVVAVA